MRGSVHRCLDGHRSAGGPRRHGVQIGMRTRTVAVIGLAAIVAAGAWLQATGSWPPALLALLATGTEKAKGQGGARPQQGPPPEVTASQPVRRPAVEWDEFSGRFEAVDVVELRARVSGYLIETHVKDGQDVKRGDLLYTIDPRPFERAVAQAKAELDQAKVRVSNARLDVDRGRPLVDRRVISEKTFDDRESLVRDGEAQVKVAEARLLTAELDLSYARIIAPVSGRLGRAGVTVGNWVSSGTSSGSTSLGTIVSQDPIQIYFDVSEANALKYKRFAAGENRSGVDALKGMKVGVGLADEPGFPHAGQLDFVDNRLDTGTATWRARAVLDNRRGLFSPGMFGRVRISGEGEKTATLLPDEAIGTDQTSRFVYVVSEDGMAQRRGVTLGPVVDGLRIVREGVTPDDWVVVRGVQKVRPGQKLAVKREPIKVSDAPQQPNTPAVSKR